MENQKWNRDEPYLHGNPWLTVLFLSILPLAFLLSAFYDVVALLLALFIGIPSNIFALIYLARTFRNTHWTKLSIVVTISLIVMTFTGIPLLVMSGYLWRD